MAGRMKKDKKEEAAEIFREKILYREWARRYTTTDKPLLAINYFKKSLKVPGAENELRTLLGLCQAQYNFTKFVSAARTCKECLKIDRRNYHVRRLQVDTLYRIGDFGYSLIYAHQGFRQRRMPFELNIYRANESIETCVGRNTAPDALKRLWPWIKKLQEYRKELLEKLKLEEDEFEGIDEDQSKFKVNDPIAQEEAYQARLDRLSTRIYLGPLTADKLFRQRFVDDPELLHSPNKESTKLLLAHASRSLRQSTFRQNIIRMTAPLYVTIFAKSARTLGHKVMVANEKRIRRYNIIILADFLLRSLHAARMRRDYPMFFRYVNRIKDQFDSYTTQMFPVKQKCLTALYKMIAWAYIDTRNLMRFDDEQTKRKYLKHHLRMPVGKLPRECELAWVKICTRKEALRTFRRRLAMTSEPLELAWLFHEFAKFLIEISRYELARYYAKKSRDAAVDAKSEQWILNATHMAMLVEICQNNRNEAKEAALSAIGSAKKLGIDYLVDFYTRALNIVDEVDQERMERATDGIATRQRLILDMMPEDLKNEVDFLFRSMEVVPAKRRLSIVPGCKTVDRKFKLPCRRRTILPSPPKDPEKEMRQALLAQYAPALDRPGFVDFEAYE